MSDGCKFIVNQHSTNTRGPKAPHRCDRPTVDDHYCRRHVESDDAQMFRALLALRDAKVSPVGEQPPSPPPTPSPAGSGRGDGGTQPREVIRMETFRPEVAVPVEVSLADQDGCVIEHGTCIIEIDGKGRTQAHTFRSSAKPDEDWPLPPHHSFQFNLLA